MLKVRCLLVIMLFSFAYVKGISQVRTVENPHVSQQVRWMPYNRMLAPAGTIIRYGDPGLENHALDNALIPHSHLLVVEDRYGLAFIQTQQKKLVYRLSLRENPLLKNFISTYSGLKVVKIKDSICIFWSIANTHKGVEGSSRIVEAYWNGKKAKIIRTFSFDPQPPAGLALSNAVSIHEEKGTLYLYTVLNGNNRAVKMRLEDGKIMWEASTGVAPFDLTIAGTKLFVTNWGGIIPNDTSKSVAGIPWGEACIDPITDAVNNGSVSVIDGNSGLGIATIHVGLHPNAILLSPDEEWAFVACANSDNVYIINTHTNHVTDSVSVRLSSVKDPFIGDSPDGLAISRDGHTLYVSNGMDNAVAVVKLHYFSKKKQSKISASLKGFIPTEAYPSGLQVDAGQLYVCNLEGEGAIVHEKEGYNSHHQLATVSCIPLPSPDRLQHDSRTVYAANLLAKARLALLPPMKNVSPKPIPERIGEPSLFRHVVYIIKENRTYDQVLGDMKEGNGDSSICSFGAKVTPNEHRLAREFCLLDNFFVSGKCSAEGHQWTDAAMVTDYVEKNVRAWFRSYPHVQNDALVYDKNGFLWNDAADHGKTVIIYGEAATPHFSNTLIWKDIYSLYLNRKTFQFYNTTTLSRVAPLLSPDYPGFDSHKIPDQLRAEAFIHDLKKYESLPGDQWPNLMILALPADHTAGMRPGFPTPDAMVADNDLALGKIIQAISHSRFWDSTAIFVTEDDSQDGWDHVSAYRTTAFVISPYSHLHITIHNNYNQTSMVRTIEQILGIPPMNALDATATPMFDCFSKNRDTSSYHFLPAMIPLDEMNKRTADLKGEAREMAIYSSKHQFDHIDGGNDDLLNRIIWFATMKNKPYPSARGND
ncbi:MAG: phosphoesterase [Chitinophagaceae bacterium]|nr:MAG: phosphoesterase [Chitinophagaceae bacterium]